MAGPLDGIRIIDTSQVLAAPAACALLADMGATVIKVEAPQGDRTRGISPQSRGAENYTSTANCLFELGNRGKQSVVVDLNAPHGPDFLRRMCKDADIFVTNMLRPGLERRDLLDETLLKVNPRLVYCYLTGYGSQGPAANRRGIGQTAFWAGSGIMGLCGDPPNLPPTGQDDYVVTLNMVAAILAALRQRDRTGKGQYVEITLQGSGVWTNAWDVSIGLITNTQPRVHNREHPDNALHNMYETKDGRWILLGLGGEQYWPRLCGVLERSEWIDDARFGTPVDRVANRETLTTLVRERLLEENLAHWKSRLDDGESMTWSPVTTIPEIVSDPQLRAMGAFGVINHPKHGTLETLNVPFVIRDAEIGVRGPAPELGQHTPRVLAEMGLSKEEIAAYTAEGVFG